MKNNTDSSSENERYDLAFLEGYDLEFLSEIKLGKSSGDFATMSPFMKGEIIKHFEKSSLRAFRGSGFPEEIKIMTDGYYRDLNKVLKNKGLKFSYREITKKDLLNFA